NRARPGRLIIRTRPVAAIIHAVSAGSILDAGAAWARAAVELPSMTAAAVSTDAIVARRPFPVMVSSPVASTDPCLPAGLPGRASAPARTCPVNKNRATGLIRKAPGSARPAGSRLGVLLELFEVRLEEQLGDHRRHHRAADHGGEQDGVLCLIDDVVGQAEQGGNRPE